MSFEPDAPDLTRWNRAGLRRFRYIDGNAATFLERLRAAEARQFLRGGEQQWQDLERDVPADTANESVATRQRRWLAQYDGERRDHAFELLRVLARSTHVLAEHIDAFANEGFLATATQFDSVRRLVALLDYRPAPPSSAITPLAFRAKFAARVDAGLAVQYLPANAPPVVFETLNALDIDPALDELRPRDWNRSQAPVVYAPVDSTWQTQVEFAPDARLPAAGTVGILRIAADFSGPERAFAVRVHAADGALLTLQGESAESPLTVARWRVSLLTRAAEVRTPQLAGADVVVVKPGHGLSVGVRIAWGSGSAWSIASVVALDGNRVQVSAGALPLAGTDLYVLTESRKQANAEAAGAVLPRDRGASGKVWSEDGSALTVYTRTQDGRSIYDYVYAERAWYLAQLAAPAAQVVSTAPAALVFDGAPGSIADGDWVVIEDAAGLHAARVLAVTREASAYALAIQGGMGVRSDSLVHLRFAGEDRPLQHDRNETPAYVAHAASARRTKLPLALTDWPSALARGRVLVVRQGAFATRVVVDAVDHESHSVFVTPPLPGTMGEARSDGPTWARADTVLYANVADASHGETKPQKILGSGDATRSSQRFRLEAKDVAWLPDASMPSGVRAAIEIFVGEQRYAQVGSLRDATSAAAAYEVQQDDDGKLSVQFGDGRNGRRLPSGSNNVRAVYRQGSGLAGNLPAGSLTKAKGAAPAIAEILQPVPAGGGAALEQTTQMRESAPKRVLTLERAVAVQDFALLASQHSAVWQAHAWRNARESGGRRVAGQETVHVVIVPAGGRPMGPLAAELEAFLEGHAMPGVAVVLEDYQPVRLHLDVTVRVDAASYVPEDVIAATRVALLSAFSLERMRLGAALFASQLLYVAEGVEGVENAVVTVLPDTLAAAEPPLAVTTAPNGGLRSLRPRPNQLLFIDPVASLLRVRSEAFTV